MELKAINVRNLEGQAANLYEALVIAGKRSREVNDLYKIEFNSRLSTIPKSRLEEESDEIGNQDQLRVSLEFEKRAKPHQVALKEVLEGEVAFKYRKTQSTHKH